jgi:hypothetical protein
LSFQPLQEAIRPWNKLVKRGVPQDKKGPTLDVGMPTRCEDDAELRTLGDLEVSRSLGEFEVCEGANTLKVAGAGLVVKAVIELAKVRQLFFSHTIGSTKILLLMVHIFNLVL